MELAGRPLIAWSLDAMRRAPGVGAAVIAAPPAHQRELSRAAGEAIGIAQVSDLHVTVVAGGATRAESVGLALAEAGSPELIAVHDAARPLLTVELIEAMIARLIADPDAAGVIAAAPLTDTVKRAHEPRPAGEESLRGPPVIERTESRDRLWAAQTPQLFRAERLREAHAADPELAAAATDDSMLVERAGGRVLIQPTRGSNLKVTTPEDLRFAELVLRERRAEDA